MAIGGLFGNQAANEDSQSQQAMIDAQMAGFNLSSPYLSNLYSGANNAYNNMLTSGPYTGDTLAGQNPYTTNTYNEMGSSSGGFMDNASALSNSGAGFGGNYQDLYNTAVGGGAMDKAKEYALNNSQGLIDSAMRDDARTLTESTLPGIGRNASASGNTNSTMKGVREAIAERGYGDRYADTSSTIQGNLIDQSLSQQQREATNAYNANSGLANAYSTGMNSFGTAANYGVGAGSGLSAYEQAKLDDAENKYNNELNFDFNALNNFGGVMSGAPTAHGTVDANMVNTTAGTVGGAMSGWGMGGKAQDYYSNNPWSMKGWWN
jgi:hypothetical protein